MIALVSVYGYHCIDDIDVDNDAFLLCMSVVTFRRKRLRKFQIIYSLLAKVV
jgi:hypothetical protein